MKWPSLVDKRLCKTPISVDIYAEGNDEDGAPIIAASYTGFCNYQDKAKSVLTADKRITEITGQAFFTGDIVPSVVVISGGEVDIFGEKRNILQGMKARNPDGTVNYTRVDLI